MIGPLSQAGGSAPAAAGTGEPDPRLREAAQAFEAVFLRQMIGSMRQAKLGEDLLGSAAADQFRDMADARLADTMAERGGFGIAEMLLNQFQRRSPR
ncbi:rod-binding protein [Sphingosinicella terrae]|uniref:rod-binding protein n=1 Tax=Sphingosinicella terrae TaxID=2172047 RepID=UPI0025493A35|nr:rod-binding protein [Sphingosinicella terrae]